MRFIRFSSGKCRCISKRVQVFVTTDVFGAVVSPILAYLVVLLLRLRSSILEVFAFATLGLPPPGPASGGLGWLPVSRLGFAHPGLISVCGLLFFGGSLFGSPVPFPPLPIRA